MVDVTRVPDSAFGYVPTPALVAPIEFTMRRADYLGLGGHAAAIRPWTTSWRDGGEYLNPRRDARRGRGNPVAAAGGAAPAVRRR